MTDSYSTAAVSLMMPDVRVWSAVSFDFVANLIPGETRAKLQTQINIDLAESILTLSTATQALFPDVIFDSIAWNGGEGGGIWRTAPSQSDRDAALQQLSFPSTQAPYAFLFPPDKLQIFFVNYLAQQSFPFAIMSATMQPKAPNQVSTQVRANFKGLEGTINATTVLSVNTNGIVSEVTTYQINVDLSWWQKLLGYLFLGPFFAAIDAAFSAVVSSFAAPAIGDVIGSYVADMINSYHSMIIAGTTLKLVLSVDTITSDPVQGIFATGGRGQQLVQQRTPSVAIVGAATLTFYNSGALEGFGWTRGPTAGVWTTNAIYNIKTVDMRSPLTAVWSIGNSVAGSTAVTVPVVYSPARGTETFTLSVTVTDADGLTASASLHIKVQSVTPPPPPSSGHGPIRGIQQS